MSVKVELGMASLSDICEKACKIYRQELVEAEFMVDVRYIFDSLADVMKIWDATNGFDCEAELVLTIEKREEEKDGTDCAD